MCYREDQPVSLEDALARSREPVTGRDGKPIVPNRVLLPGGSIIWVEGLPQDVCDRVAREFEANMRSSPMIGCKRGSEIEVGDRIVMGAGVSYCPDFIHEQSMHRGPGRWSTGVSGGAQHVRFLYDDDFYEVSSSSIDRV